MSKKKNIIDCSLLDMHKYSKDAFQYLYDKLTDKGFKRAYVAKDRPINAVTGILWDITQEDDEVTKIIEGMDKIDNIKAESSKSRLEKIANTWIKKAYREYFVNGYKISRSLFVKFTKNIFEPKSEENRKQLEAASKKLFDKTYNTYRNRQHRITNSDKFNELVARYPKLNIDKAYRYAIVSGKFNLNADDIEEFEYILKFALSKKEDSNKKNQYYMLKKV
ncbi:hypothetical protein [Sulfurospirillum diekertiae]|uniref:Uncharacterized protein n=1 Tax=Sulfurospirillum diekertiae TaxID=1854492 RepID=A0AA92IY94_9BACT|nr:hypothetical protein [Sulfurospirillum diekertiae]QIR75267.1 hypothetical protein FA584_03195 [Sulfurospirillum diekertiae]